MLPSLSWKTDSVFFGSHVLAVAAHFFFTVLAEKLCLPTAQAGFFCCFRALTHGAAFVVVFVFHAVLLVIGKRRDLNVGSVTAWHSVKHACHQ